MVAFIEAIRWNYLYGFSTLGFVLVLVFSMTGHPALAAMIGVSVITWWTWIPGMSSKYIQEVSTSDFFSVIIALQIGAFESAVMGFFSVLFMMVFGKFERPTWVIRGAIVIFIVNLTIPWMYRFAGDNLLIALYYYTVVFYVLMSVLAILISPAEFFEDIRMVMMAFPVAFLTNTMYVTLFGDLVEGFVQEGLQLNVNTLAFMGIILMIVTMTKVWKWHLKKTEGQPKKRFKPKPILPPTEGPIEPVQPQTTPRTQTYIPRTETTPIMNTPTQIDHQPPKQVTQLETQETRPATTAVKKESKPSHVPSYFTSNPILAPKEELEFDEQKSIGKERKKRDRVLDY